MEGTGSVAAFRRVGLLGVIAVLVTLALSCTVRTVPTGHVGVVTLFGAITGEQLSEDIHLVNPLKRVSELSIRTKETKEHAEAPRARV
jgi:regulator of protease activity HflC (stomatin/prohibitin superfamily)